jgi:hypothetical protein
MHGSKPTPTKAARPPAIVSGQLKSPCCPVVQINRRPTARPSTATAQIARASANATIPRDTRDSIVILTRSGFDPHEIRTYRWNIQRPTANRQVSKRGNPLTLQQNMTATSGSAGSQVRGGSVALDVCAHDARIAACADFEGDLFGSRAETQGVRRPVLVTGSRAKGRPPIASAPGQDVRTRMLTVLGQAGESSVWYVKVTGGSHTSFSDAPWMMPQTLTRFGGELMTPERSADLYTGMLDAFIHAYQAGGGGDAAFQAFLATATETQGERFVPDAKATAHGRTD